MYLSISDQLYLYQSEKINQKASEALKRSWVKGHNDVQKQTVLKWNPFSNNTQMNPGLQ